MKDRIERDKCKVCGREFIVKYIYYPSRMESNRDSYYACPYCKSDESCVAIRLQGNEEVETLPLEKM